MWWGWFGMIAAAIGVAVGVKLLARGIQSGRGSVRRRSSGAPSSAGAGICVNYYANVRHNQKDRWFQFRFQKVGLAWRIYILRMPSLALRSHSLHLTHRHTDGKRYWICYDPAPRTLADAQAIARGWADRELEYIATGTPFENQRW